MSRRLWLYSVACTPLSSTDPVHSQRDHVLLFCLDSESNTHVIQVQNYQTSILLQPDAYEVRQLGQYVDNLRESLPLKIKHLVTRIEVSERVKLIGFTNSESTPVLKLFLRNERDRDAVKKSLTFHAHMNIGPVTIKQFLHSRRDAETQFLFDSGLQLNSWFETTAQTDYATSHLFDKGVRSHIASFSDLTFMADQSEPAPILRKLCVRVVAHSSTATTANQFDPSSDIAADEIRCIGYSRSDANEKEPHALEIGDCNNSEKQLLQRFGEIVKENNTHVIVFAADEHCNPNALVYLFERAKRHDVNLHFSKLHTLNITCELKPCGKEATSTYLVFKHPGVERVDICEVLRKAMVSPNLDGFRLLDALRHPKLIRNKKPFVKMLHLNYHGLNSFSTPEAIRADITMQVALLKAVENDSEFTNTQANISRICDLDLTSVCERGQQARVGNLWARAYHKNNIIINDEQVKKPYVVVKKPIAESSYPDAPWLKNPPVSAMRGEKRYRHIIKQELPAHLKHLLAFEHNNIFEIPPPIGDIKEKEEPILEEPSSPRAKKQKSTTTLEEGNPEQSQSDEEEEIEEEPVAKTKTGWWSNKNGGDFAPKSKKRKTKEDVESKKRFRGGLVLDPELGFYTLPEEAACTFDFGSLYPSIIEGFVLCYMRVIYDVKWLSDPDLEVEYVPITSTECLVLAKRYKGKLVQTITPQIVHDIVELRKSIRKKQANEEEGSFKWNTLERAQLAAKVVQNSVYGYIGSDTSGMTCTALAAAVTQIGQWMNRNIRFLILFFGGFVYYGDTDSCMARMWVALHLKTEDEIYQAVYDQAFHIQALGTKLFPAPNKLEFETVKKKFLLAGKKTYAAIQMSSKPRGWTLPPESKPNIKGMAAKKRDKCQYAHNIGESLILRLLHNTNDSIENYVVWYRGELDKIPKGVLTTIEELDPFVITCSLNTEYKKETGVLALSLAAMIAAETGARPRPNTRLAFVSAHFRDQRLHADACVIPDVFLRRKDRIDIEYYLDKQIWNCVKQILCLPVHDELRDKLDAITKRYVHEWKNKRDGRRELTNFFTKVPSAKKLQTEAVCAIIDAKAAG